MSNKPGKKLTMEELGRKSVSEYRDAKKIPLVVVLDNIRSLHNIGSVFRTSDAFSIEKIVLTGITAQPPHREIQKTALGATDTVDWEYLPTCMEALETLKSNGYRILGVEQVAGSVLLHEFSYSNDKLALVFGNEVKGVDQEVLDMCDGYLEIPQLGTKHSLNISVSVGVVLWELVRKSL